MDIPDEHPKIDIEVFQADGITVFFEPSRCIDLGECLLALPSVFDKDKSPWIQPDQASVDAVAEAVFQCPSGALKYEIDGEIEEVPISPTRVRPQTDGPLLMRGDLRVVLQDGELHETRAAFCRCGRSDNKPFCDHTCQRTGWSSSWHPPADE